MKGLVNYFKRQGKTVKCKQGNDWVILYPLKECKSIIHRIIKNAYIVVKSEYKTISILSIQLIEKSVQIGKVLEK